MACKTKDNTACRRTRFRLADRMHRSSWLQIQKSGFEIRRHQIYWEVVGLERGPLSLVSTTEELLGRKSSGFGLESREYGSRDQSRWPRSTLYLQKLALTPPTSGGRRLTQYCTMDQYKTKLKFARGLMHNTFIKIIKFPMLGQYFGLRNTRLRFFVLTNFAVMINVIWCSIT
jgi:hypothetical protein